MCSDVILFSCITDVYQSSYYYHHVYKYLIGKEEKGPFTLSNSCI